MAKAECTISFRNEAMAGPFKWPRMALLTISFLLLCRPCRPMVGADISYILVAQPASVSQGQSQGQGQQKGESELVGWTKRSVSTIGEIEHKDPFKKGRSIMEEVERRAKSASEHLFLTMIIRDSAGKERKRTLEVWNEYGRNGRRKNLMRFTSPQMVRNTGLLSLERDAGEDDQWLYLPILRKSKRIAASAKTNEFVGTDFTFEDLSAENIDDFKYEFQGEQEVGGHNCFVVKAAPSERRLKSTGYKERIIFVRKDIYAPVEIRHYDRDGRLYKKWLASDLVNIKDKCWRANREEMAKIIEKKCTIVLVDKRLASDALEDTIFTQRELTKEY